MAKNLIAGDTTTIIENGNDISVDLNTDYKDKVDSVGNVDNLETTDNTDLVSAINEIYEQVEDTGWQNLTLVSGASQGTNGAVPAIRRIGNHVFVRGSIAFTASSSASVGLATIPEGFRPAAQHYTIGATGGQTYARFYYTTGGSLGVDWVWNCSGARYSGSITWSNIDADWFID